MNALRASLVVPARNEEGQIGVFLDRLEESVTLPVEVLIVVDSADDSTLNALKGLDNRSLTIRPIVSTFGKGPANAIKFGVASASCKIVVVTMADGSDDPQIIDDLIKLVERGCAVAAASRYMAGGQQIGGPRLKKLLSKNASRALWLILGVGTHDSTNSFKAYSKNRTLGTKIIRVTERKEPDNLHCLMHIADSRLDVFVKRLNFVNSSLRSYRF
jgi:glycosyltransferase involved in cell wall biosynthesis